MSETITGINNSVSNLENKTLNLKKISSNFKNIWKSSAANNLVNKIDEILTKIEKELENLAKFQEALALIEKCKKIDEEIIKLNNSILNITNEQNTDEIEAHNTSINYQISLKNKEQEELKKKIISLLSAIEGTTNLISTSLPTGLSGKIIQQYNSGAIYEFTTQNGEIYEAYIPNNYNKNTQIMIYEAGDGRHAGERTNPNNWNKFKNKFETDGCNAIVLNSKRANNTITYYNDLVDECNLNNPKPITVSHSGGTIYALKETNELIKQNNQNDQAIVVMLDGYAPADYLQNQGIIDNFKENNTLLLAFSQGKGNTEYAKQYENLARKGVNVLILYDESEYGKSHSGVNTSFTEKNIMEYILGEGHLPDNYKIKSYDSTSNQFVEVNL